jgi:hypothetical protein
VAASKPLYIPRKGRKDILVRSWTEASDNNIYLASGGITYAAQVVYFPGCWNCRIAPLGALAPDSVTAPPVRTRGTVDGVWGPDSEAALQAAPPGF